jgi:hypothetical protein
MHFLFLLLLLPASRPVHCPLPRMPRYLNTAPFRYGAVRLSFLAPFSVGRRQLDLLVTNYCSVGVSAIHVSLVHVHPIACGRRRATWPREIMANCALCCMASECGCFVFPAWSLLIVVCSTISASPPPTGTWGARWGRWNLLHSWNNPLNTGIVKLSRMPPSLDVGSLLRLNSYMLSQRYDTEYSRNLLS